MTARCIPIESCAACPHRDHEGAFTRVRYKPVCRKANRKLPYKVNENDPNWVAAEQKPGIPSWCPLPALEPQVIAST